MKFSNMVFLEAGGGMGGMGGGGGGELLGSIFAGYVPLATENSYPNIVLFVASYRPHLNHFWARPECKEQFVKY